MTFAFKDRVKQAVSAGGTGTLTLGAAVSAYQAFAAGDDAGYFPYVIEDGAAWEVGYGLYTHSGTSFARTVRYTSSTGSALNVTTAAVLFCDLGADLLSEFLVSTNAIIPGGRLTAQSNVAVPTSDQTGVTTLYYTPYVHRGIKLWDGQRRRAIPFVQTSLALGTLTNALSYDVFGYLSAGALALELLAWSSATARATSLTLGEDGYYKTGDQTRLHLGSFYTTSTTTTEDSAGGVTNHVGGKRHVWNRYWREQRALGVIDTQAAGYTYAGSERQVNANGGNMVEWMNGWIEDKVYLRAHMGIYQNATGGYAGTGIGLNSNSAYSGIPGSAYNSGGGSAIYYQMTGELEDLPGLGYNIGYWLEHGNGGNPTFYGNDGSRQIGGVRGHVWA